MALNKEDICEKILDSLLAYKSKDETAKDLSDRFQIPIELTNGIWDEMERSNREIVNKYNTYNSFVDNMMSSEPDSWFVEEMPSSMGTAQNFERGTGASSSQGAARIQFAHPMGTVQGGTGASSSQEAATIQFAPLMGTAPEPATANADPVQPPLSPTMGTAQNFERGTGASSSQGAARIQFAHPMGTVQGGTGASSSQEAATIQFAPLMGTAPEPATANADPVQPPLSPKTEILKRILDTLVQMKGQQDHMLDTLVKMKGQQDHVLEVMVKLENRKRKRSELENETTAAAQERDD